MIELHLPTLLDAAIHAAKAAGEVIESYRDKEVTVTRKGLGGGLAAEVLTEVDLRCQALIESRLAPLCERYAIAFVGEESRDHFARKDSAYSWLVDPIDGTLAFIEKREGYSVSIGLIDQAGTPLLGVVFDPACQKLYAAISGGRCIVANRELEDTLNTLPNGQEDAQGVITCFLDRSYKDDRRYERIVERLSDYAAEKGYSGLAIVEHLGAALNACRILDTRPAVYIKLPKEKGGSLWDYAASAAIFTALGLPVSDVYGKPLDLNRRDSTYLNHKGVIYASDVELSRLLIKSFTEDI